MDLDALLARLAAHRQAGRRIVFTFGHLLCQIIEAEAAEPAR